MFRGSNLVTTSIFLALLSFPFVTKAEEHPLLGVEHPPLPGVTEDRGGWLIKDPYTVKEVLIDQERLLLLNRLLKRDKQGKGLYKVLDVLTLPQITETEQTTGGLLCLVNGQQDHGIVAIMKSDYNVPYLTKARKAWRVENEKFNAISIQGLRFQCDNPSYGL